MDASPLVKAHDHARAAVEATRTDYSAAVSEHAQAAGEFANAAKGTSSLEALRTLRLLEQHHKRLSELLRSPLEHSSQKSAEGGEGSDSGEKQAIHQESPASPDRPVKVGDSPAASSVTASTLKQLPSLGHQARYPARDLTSSIASNLATARGIRSKYRGQPLTPSVSNDLAPGSLEVRPRGDSPTKPKPKPKVQSRPVEPGRPSWVPPNPSAGHRTEAHAADAAGTEVSGSARADEGFSRFYSTFGSLINRLSAPLAFAGLPLITEESTPAAKQDVVPAGDQPPQQRFRSRSSQAASANPDLSKIYSQATLRSLKGEGHSASDSFYVVPTSGHTVSYANIVTYDQKERRRMAASATRDDGPALFDAGDAEFVDAAQLQGPATPGLKKRPGRGQPGGGSQKNALEEVYLENASLKEMLDKLSRRLHAFELNSQTSHLALAQSLRLQRPGSPTSSGGGGGAGSWADTAEEALRRRNRELEDQLAAAMKRMDALERTLEKYRDRWEKLKASARARREAQGSADAGEA